MYCSSFERKNLKKKINLHSPRKEGFLCLLFKCWESQKQFFKLNFWSLHRKKYITVIFDAHNNASNGAISLVRQSLRIFSFGTVRIVSSVLGTTPHGTKSNCLCLCLQPFVLKFFRSVTLCNWSSSETVFCLFAYLEITGDHQ